MASRSHLYAVDSFPTRTERPRSIRGISEWGWSIPLSHMILMGPSPVACTSVIWPEHTIGVLADFARGTETLLSFLGAMNATTAADEARAFLEKHRGKYFLLEPGEILDASGEPFDEAMPRLVETEIPEVSDRVAAALRGREKAWLAELARNPVESLGLYWSDVLYYSPK
jgi:hypothetical protein